jgi:transposase
MAALPPGLVQALGPVLEQIADMTVKVKAYDRAIKQVTETEYREAQALIKVYGVGQLTALTYVSLWGAKNGSSKVAMWVATWDCDHEEVSQALETLSLASPRLEMSTSAPCWSSAPTTCSVVTEKTQAYDKWGLSLASRGGKQARNRAIVAVARKLACAASPDLDHPGTIRAVLCCRCLS